MKPPGYYLPVMPYLIVNKAYDFIDFVQKVFNAKTEFIAPREEGVIMHGEITIGKAAIMFCDATEVYLPRPAGMFILISNVEEVYQKALANGAVSIQEPAEREYGLSAGFQDVFGNQWWLTKPDE
jgi:PhnB protein